MSRRRPSLRFASGFLAGGIAAGGLLAVLSGERTFAATRYEDLSLFSSVLRIIRENYVDEGSTHQYEVRIVDQNGNERPTLVSMTHSPPICPTEPLRFRTHVTLVTFSDVVQANCASYPCIVDDPAGVPFSRAQVERDTRPLARRYLGEKRGDRYIETTGGEEGHRGSIRVAIRPERWLSVDYGKVGGPAVGGD